MTAPPPAQSQRGPAPAGTCASCGQPLRPGAVKCEFCGLPIEGRAPAPRTPAFRTCPHCGADGIPLAGGRCPDCREFYGKPVSAGLAARAKVSRLLRGVKISAPTFAIGLIVLTGLTTFFVNWSYSKKSGTANNLRNMKQRLEIFQGENGGFPASLEPVEQRYGTFPPDWKTDSWGTPIRYTVSGESRGNPEMPMMREGSPPAESLLHTRCDLRSAGPNRTFGDDDDISWQGAAD